MSVKKKYSETEPLYRRIFTGFLVCVVFAVLFADVAIAFVALVITESLHVVSW